MLVDREERGLLPSPPPPLCLAAGTCGRRIAQFCFAHMPRILRGGVMRMMIGMV